MAESFSYQERIVSVRWEQIGASGGYAPGIAGLFCLWYPPKRIWREKCLGPFPCSEIAYNDEAPVVSADDDPLKSRRAGRRKSLADKRAELANRKDQVVDLDTLGLFLYDQTRATYEELLGDQKLDRGMVKSYLIESHLRDTTLAAAWGKLLERTKLKHGAASFSLNELSDSRVMRLTVREKAKEPVDFFVDCSKERYWKAFTVDDATNAGAAIRKLVVNDCALDHVWLPQDLLKKIGEWGEVRALKLNHNRDELFRQNEEVDPSDDAAKRRRRAWSLLRNDEKLVSELKGTSAQEQFNSLFRNEKLKDQVNLSSIQIGRRDQNSREYDPNIEPGFSIEDVSYRGRFKTRGTSIELHQKLLESTLRLYSGVVKEIEESCIRIDSAAPKGNPFLFGFHTRIDDLEAYINAIFSGKEPFRLWGIGRRLGKDAYRVLGTDVHSGSKFHAEFFPTYIRFYLHDGGCGNTITRFWSNLHRYVEGTATLLNSKGQEIKV